MCQRYANARVRRSPQPTGPAEHTDPHGDVQLLQREWCGDAAAGSAASLHQHQAAEHGGSAYRRQPEDLHLGTTGQRLSFLRATIDDIATAYALPIGF